MTEPLVSFASRFPGEAGRGLQAAGITSAGPHQLQTSWHHLLRLPQAGLTQDVPGLQMALPSRQSKAKQQPGWERENMLLGTQISQREKKKGKSVLLSVKF